MWKAKSPRSSPRWKICSARNSWGDAMKFADVVEIKNGRNQKAVENPKGKYPIYGSGGIIGYADNYICDAETVIIGRKGSINKPIFVEEPFWNVDTAFGISAKKEKLLPKYLYYFCLNFDFERLNKTVTIPSLTKSDLLRIEINVPSLPEQERIVAVLDSADRMIRLRRRELSLLDDLVKSRFVEMFGDPDLSQVQDNWRPISSIGKVVGGSTPKTDIAEYWGGSYRWLTPAELTDASGYIFDSVRKLTKAGVDSCSLMEMPVGTVILSSRAPIGKVAIAGNTFYCNQGFKNIICGEEIHPVFLFYLLLMNTEYLKYLGRGATFKEISKTIVENIRIPVPPISLQNEFADFGKKVEQMKASVQSAIDESQLLFDALMQQYFG